MKATLFDRTLIRGRQPLGSGRVPLSIAESDGTEAPLEGYTTLFGSDSNFIVRSDAGVYGGKHIEKKTLARNQYFAPDALIGVPNADVLFLYEQDTLASTAANPSMICFLRLDGVGFSGANRYYYVRLDTNDTLVSVRSDIDGVNTGLVGGALGFTFAVDTTYGCRMRMFGNSLAFRMWELTDPSDIVAIRNDEPEDWTFETINDDLDGVSGDFGFGNRGGTSGDILRRYVPLSYSLSGSA